MGNVFRRSSGRGWRMRQRSMELWQKWIAILNTENTPLTLNKPLVQLADSEAEASIMERLINNRKDLGLQRLRANAGIDAGRVWPINRYGGLISHKDGRINPLQLQQCLLNALDKLKVHKICEKVIKLERGSSTKDRQWQIHLSDGKVLIQEIIIICAPLGSEALLKDLGYNFPISPVLGQVLDLQLKTDYADWSDWPAVLCCEGVNLIPYKNNRILMGATLEPGTKTSTQALEEMKSMNGKAPDWLKQASIAEQWSGLRGRPSNNAAPILKNLEPGLIIATGHYRNGILLAPASAEWVLKEVNQLN